MKFIERPTGQLIDRFQNESEENSIVVVMGTLDAENFIEKSLYTVYREIPVQKLIICDGDSKDTTLEILKKFPRVEVFVKPEIISSGKVIEFLFSKVETEWFVLIDSDIFLAEGWYDEMKKYEKQFDVIESSKAIKAYHFYREFPEKLQEDYRASDLCHLIKKESIKNYHCDDDFIFRVTDYLIRQSVECSGYKYGKVNSTEHSHNETERIPYESDLKKNYLKVVMNEERIILNKQKRKEMMIKNAKAIVKYLDPNYLPSQSDHTIDSFLRLLDKKWIEDNGPQWLQKYNSVTRLTSYVETCKRIYREQGIKYLIKRLLKGK